MAILVKPANTIIYEIPKTGTTWIREVLKRMKIEHVYLKTPNRACDRHSPWWAYDLSLIEPKPYQIAVVRHPMHWYESYWAYSLRRRDTGLQGGWHIRKYLHFDSLHVYDNYEKWVEYVLREHPAIYTRIVESFCGPCGYHMMDAVIKQEELAEQLATFLCKANHNWEKRDLLEVMNEIERVNVSNRALITYEQRTAMESKICEMEIEVIKRFYPSE